MELTIRVANATDLPQILDLYKHALEDKTTLSIEAAGRLFERMQQYPSYTLYVAEAEGRAVGTFALLIMDNLGHGGTPSAVVEDVAVSPAWQGQGIGKRMMHFALAQARTAGCYKMALSSNLRRTSAHAFYESLGFRKHGYSFVMELE
jgi:GNAT superfamily N-acetyltransferase